MPMIVDVTVRERITIVNHNEPTNELGCYIVDKLKLGGTVEFKIVDPTEEAEQRSRFTF